MDLRQLEYFVAVAEQASFTRAAERVHITQSGISAQIRQLERDVGAVLIDRSTRRATLTRAGDAALGPARAALAAAAAVRAAVDEVTGVVRGRLAIGMVSGCTVTPLFAALAVFHTAHPGVELSLIEDNSDRLLDGVRSGLLDAALVGTAGPVPGDLEHLRIISEPVVAAVPPGHPLARRRRLTLRALAAHPLVALPLGTGIRTVFEDACAAAHVEARVVLEASSPDAVADLAVRGMGVGLLSASMAEARQPALVGLPIVDVVQAAVLSLAYPLRPAPATLRFLDHARAAFGTGGPAA